jgi:REP element-mobilizing transposase RayT
MGDGLGLTDPQAYGIIALFKMVTRMATRTLKRKARQRPQLALPLPSTWGGRRPGAGRKPSGRAVGVPHRVRPVHLARHPVHVTLRARRAVGSLHARRVFPLVRAALTAASGPSFRLVHFSVQADHVHLLVEARDKAALSLGMRGLVIRLARAVNRARGRWGAVWADRYHGRALTTPREVRHALVYILMNYKKHRPEAEWKAHAPGQKHRPGAWGIDPYSSGRWFAGWRGRPVIPPAGVPSPVAAPRTWLARDGWRRYGLIGLDEQPQPAASPVRGRPGGDAAASRADGARADKPVAVRWLSAYTS